MDQVQSQNTIYITILPWAFLFFFVLSTFFVVIDALISLNLFQTTSVEQDFLRETPHLVLWSSWSYKTDKGKHPTYYQVVTGH